MVKYYYPFLSRQMLKTLWTEELVGYNPWGRKELDTTERLHFHFFFFSFNAKERESVYITIHFSFIYFIGLTQTQQIVNNHCI